MSNNIIIDNTKLDNLLEEVYNSLLEENTVENKQEEYINSEISKIESLENKIKFAEKIKAIYQMNVIQQFSVDDILKLLPLLLDKNIEDYKILGKLSKRFDCHILDYPLNLEAFEYIIKEDINYIEYFTSKEEIKVKSSANINDDEDEFKNTLNDLGFLVYDQIASLAALNPSNNQISSLEALNTSNEKDNEENTLNKSSKEIIKKQPENSLYNQNRPLADILWLFLSNFPSFEILNEFNKFLNPDAKDINVLENSNDNANIKMSELRLDILKNYIKKLRSTPLENLQRDDLKKIFTDFKVKLIEESGILNCFINKNNSETKSKLLQLLSSYNKYYLYKKISESNIFKNYSKNNEDRLKLIEFLTKNFLLEFILKSKNSFKTLKDYEMIFNIRKGSDSSLNFESLFKDIDWSNQDHLNFMRNILIHGNYQNDSNKEEINKLKNNKNIKEMDSLILDVLDTLSQKQLVKFIENDCFYINCMSITEMKITNLFYSIKEFFNDIYNYFFPSNNINLNENPNLVIDHKKTI